MRRILRGMVAAGLVGGLALGTVAVGLARPAVVQAAQESRVDLNTATVEELATLPGIGPAKARAIVEYRGKQRFSTPEELMQVQGVGAKLFERLRDHVTVGSVSASGNPASKAR